MESTAIIFRSAGELARFIRTGELSSREVVDAHIDRIEAVNGRLNAVVVPLFERARERADAADAALRADASTPGVLHGVPITVKEQLLVEGTPTTFGLVNQRDHRAAADGPLVARLQKAGAIILGKTNVSQLLVFIESDNPLYGRTNNPWSLDRSCGGSSGGEAAIVAAGGSPLGIGSDLGGSIREPAHFCGIHGFKPTSGRLTLMDTRPDILRIRQDAILPQPGPMARSVADLALAMSVLAAPGQEKFDPSVPPVAWRDPALVSIQGLRIAFYTDDGYFRAAPALRRAVLDAAAALRDRGAQVEQWEPPAVGDAVALFLAIISAGGTAPFTQALRGDKPVPQIAGLLRIGGLPGPVRTGLARSMQLFGQTRLPRVARVLGERTALEYWELAVERANYRARFLSALDAGGFDAIICPPTSLPAVRHGNTAKLPDFDSYARLFNLLGMPAGTVAATRVRDGEESDRVPGKDIVERTARSVERGSRGLPVGVQVVARHWREDVALALMAALEDHFRGTPDYPTRPPI